MMNGVPGAVVTFEPVPDRLIVAAPLLVCRMTVAARAEALLGLNVSGPVLQAWPALSTRSFWRQA